MAAKALSDIDQKLVGWLAERFQSTGTWPVYEDAVLFCFQGGLPLGRLERNAHGLFKEIGNPGGAHYWGLSSGLLVDMDVCPEAIDLAKSLVDWAIPELVNSRGAVMKTATEIARIHGLPTGAVVMNQLEYLLQNSRLEVHRGEDGWAVRVPFTLLRVPPPPTFETIFLPERQTLEQRLEAGLPSAVNVGVASKRPPTRRLTDWVFVASTWEDLKDHREHVMWAILGQKRLPLGMELWAPDGSKSVERSLAELAEATVMVLIFGCRYGNAAREGDARSFTELEYDTAKERGIDVLPFIPDDTVAWPPSVIDSENADRLRKFRDKVAREHHVRFYTSAEDLRYAVPQALMDWEARRGR